MFLINILIHPLKIVLLTNRDLKSDAIKSGGSTVIERTDVPTAKQVAVIWVQEEGLAPEVKGSKIKNTKSTPIIKEFGFRTKQAK